MIDINSKIEPNWKRSREYTRKHRILKRHLVRDKIIESECALKRQKTQELNSSFESEILSALFAPELQLQFSAGRKQVRGCKKDLFKETASFECLGGIFKNILFFF